MALDRLSVTKHHPKMESLLGRSLRVYKLFGCYPMFAAGHPNSWNKIYSVFLCFLYCATTLAFTYLAIHESGLDKELIMGMSQTYLQLALNLNIIIRTSILPQFGLLLSAIESIQFQDHDNKDDHKAFRKFYTSNTIKMIFFYFFFILTLILGYLGWAYRFPSGYALKQISQFCAFVTIILQWQILKRLQWTLILWNKKLSREFTSRNIFAIRILYRLNHYSEMLICTRNACERFNDYFGLHMVLQIVVSAQNLLGFIQSLLGYTRNRFTPFFSICLITQQLFRLSLGTVIAVKCHHIRHEYDRTKVTAFKILVRLQQRIGGQNKGLVKNLLFLCKDTTRPLSFHAAGLFKVDYSTIFMFVNLIITYVIVVIQFSTASTPLHPMFFIVNERNNSLTQIPESLT